MSKVFICTSGYEVNPMLGGWGVVGESYVRHQRLQRTRGQRCVAGRVLVMRIASIDVPIVDDTMLRSAADLKFCLDHA